MSHEHKTSEEGLDNTNSVASIIETGDLHEVNMILGTRERVRHAGVIRPGIKIPLAACTDQQKTLYRRLLDQNQGFEAIDKAMLEIAPKGYDKKTCLRPSNSDYFTIRDSDFKRPADADMIRSRYADPDGKVRRIPVWMPFSDIEKVIPHNFRAFDGGANLRCVSFYDDDGNLKFKYLPKNATLPAKPEAWLILDSDDEEKASKACGYKVVFGGMYRVFVPGIRSAGEIVVPTRSWYGLGESVAVLRRIRSILGRFDGLFNGDPFFELCKVEAQVTAPDGKKQMQWIVTLELAVDPIELARYADPVNVAARSLHAMQALTGGVPAPKATVAEPAPLQPGVALPVAATATDDLPPGLGEPGAGPEPPLQGEGTAQKDPRHEKGVTALVALVHSHSLTRADLDNLAASAYQGQVLSELSVPLLEQFYKSVAFSLKENGASFVEDVKGMREA
jgi:hypothetical protein